MHQQETCFTAPSMLNFRGEPTSSMNAERAIRRARYCLAALLLAVLSLSAVAQDIVVGRTIPLSGAIAAYGKAKMEGADLAFKQANDNGGVGGRRLRVVTLDDAYDPEKAIANVRELDQKHGAIALTNILGVPVVAKLMPVLEELKLPAVGLSSGSPLVREPAQRYVFPVRANFRDEANHIVKLLRTLGITRIVLLEQDDLFGKTVADAIRYAIHLNGAQLAATVKFKRDQPEAPSTIRVLMPSEPQAILIAANAIPASEFIKEYRTVGGGARFYAMSVTDTTQIAKLAGEAARGIGFSQIVPLPADGSRRIAREYMDSARAASHQPSFYGFEGFLEAKVLLEGLRNMRAPTREGLVDSLERLRKIDMGGFQVEYGSGNRRGSDFVELVIIGSDGRLRK